MPAGDSDKIKSFGDVESLHGRLDPMDMLSRIVKPKILDEPFGDWVSRQLSVKCHFARHRGVSWQGNGFCRGATGQVVALNRTVTCVSQPRGHSSVASAVILVPFTPPLQTKTGFPGQTSQPTNTQRPARVWKEHCFAVNEVSLGQAYSVQAAMARAFGVSPHVVRLRLEEKGVGGIGKAARVANVPFSEP